MTNQEINKTLNNNAELLAKFKIPINYYITENVDSTLTNFVITGGCEVLVSTANGDKEEAMLEYIGVKNKPVSISSAKALPYKYVEVEFDKAKLEELLVHREVDRYSKEDAVKMNNDIKSKQELESNIVYITDKQPMTNTLALAKQFDLGHRVVIQKLYELGSMYPSVLMQMRYDVYSDTSKTGGRGRKPDTVGNDRSAENSADLSSQKTYQSFVHISEDVYYKFVKKISTPMNVNSNNPEKRTIAVAKLVHIESKQDEYFNAFTKVRKFLLESDTSSKELEAIMRRRTEQTSELMGEIYDFVTKHNEFYKDNQLPLINFNKLIFNIVNHLSDINAINYTPPTKEELKSNSNRLTKDEELQKLVTLIEQSMMTALRMGSKHHIDIIDILTSATKMTENEVYSALKEYNAEYLITMIKPK